MAIYTYQFLISNRQGFITTPTHPSEQSEGFNHQIDPRLLQDSMSLDDMPPNTSPEEASSSSSNNNNNNNESTDMTSLQTDLIREEHEGTEVTEFSWFGTLPAEIRVIILEYVFGDEQFEGQLDEERFHLVDFEREEIDKIDASAGYLVKTHAAILRLPSFRNLFVSHEFLAEALPVYARISYTYLDALIAPEALGPRVVHPPDLIEGTLLDSLSLSRNLVIHTDDWRAWYINGAQVLRWFFPQLRRIDVVAPENLALTPGLPIHTNHGHFSRKPTDAQLRRQMAQKWLLTPLDVQLLLADMVLPHSILASLQCNLAMNNLDPAMQAFRSRTIRFREAAILAWMLKTIAWEGTVFYHVTFDCWMDSQDPDGAIACKLKLKLDLSNNRLVKAIFTV